MNTFRKLLIAFPLFTVFCATGNSQNLLLNPSFESPAIPADSIAIANPTSWVGNTSTRIINGNYSVPELPGPQDGQQYVSLGNDGVQTTISQTFTIASSGSYKLTWYDNAGDAPQFSSPYSVTVLEGQSVVANVDLAVIGTAVWVLRNMQLDLNSGAHTLVFSSHQPTPGGLSVQIDNISLLTSDNITLNDGGITKLEVVARDTALGMDNQIEDIFPTALPFSGNHTATRGGSFSTAQYDLTEDSFIITSSGSRVGQLDSRANVQPTIFFSVSADTTYAITGTMNVADPGSTGKYAALAASLTDVDTSEVLYFSNQEEFGAVDQFFQLGGMAGNLNNELQGSATGVLLAGHRYKLFYVDSIYAANSGDSASFTGHFNLTFGGSIANQPPICNAGNPQTTEAEGALTVVQLNGSLSIDPDGDDLEFEWSVAANSGATITDPSAAVTTGQFPIGPTLVTLTVSDGKGGVSVCDVLITIQDTTPPVVVCATDKISLTPDRSMQAVTIVVQASDLGGNPENLILECTVTSSEPDNTTPAGAMTGDVSGHDGYTSPVSIPLTYNSTLNQFSGAVTLRGERTGDQTGRIYSIICRVTDAGGNETTASCVVLVPHDRRRR